MKTIISNKIQPPKSEPTIAGRCRVVSRNPILIPEGATAENFDTKYGFYKYQPKSTFELVNDIYPISKNDKNSNALFFQTPNRLHLFILKSGTLPAAKMVQSTVNQLIGTSVKKNEARYSRENYIFLEKTKSGKLLFIDKGETEIRLLSSGNNSFYHLDLPIFVLSTPQFYQYKHEREKVYFLGSSNDYYDLRENNDDDNAVTSFMYSLPQFIEDMIVAGSCQIDNVAYPYINGLSSDDLNAPRAIFNLEYYNAPELDDAPNISTLFQIQTGAFLMNNIERTKGNNYQVSYQFYQPNTSNLYSEVYKIIGKLRIYGYNPAISMERQMQTNAFESPLNDAMRGVVLRLDESVAIRNEIFETCDDGGGGGNSGQPSGCPPA
jgi:hypothetical protein